MPIRRLIAPLAAALLLAPSLLAQGQPAGVLLRGEVVARETGQPLDHAMLSLQPAGRQTFSSEQGIFGFAAVPPGTYRLRVAHLGYAPREVAVTIVEGTPARLRVELQRTTFTLGAVRVVAYKACTKPGPPDPRTSPDFAGVFEQLRINAEQYRLLADSFPFGYRFQRTQASRLVDSTHVPGRVDTIFIRSDARRWGYRVGDVVELGPEGYVMQLPSLVDFAGPDFLRSHCFYYAGVDSTSEGRLVRIDFRAADRIRAPDVNGSILLDADSYQIRRSELELSIVPRELTDVVRAAVTTVFREVSPSIVVFGEVDGATVLRPSRAPQALAETTENQHLLEFGWLRADPRRGPQNP